MFWGGGVGFVGDVFSELFAYLVVVGFGVLFFVFVEVLDYFFYVVFYALVGGD